MGKFALSKSKYDTSSQWKPEMGSFYDLSINDLDGKPFNLSSLRGKVALVSNVASECGYTKCGYQFMVDEQKKYEARNFTCLGFPCNQFGGQEPGDAKDIKDFAVSAFKVSFPLFEKVEVNGPNTHPVWQYLKRVYPGDVSWNFHGWFVLNAEGIPVARFNKEPYEQIDAFIKKVLDDRDAAQTSTPAEAAPAVTS
jgi:glutathione peroxidase